MKNEDEQAVFAAAFGAAFAHISITEPESYRGPGCTALNAIPRPKRIGLKARDVAFSVVNQYRLLCAKTDEG